ncbi:hypothetical protein PR202_ga00690 [Eleusine coracana subsp. coracana]|uniref:Uncharacterized protein n=1 Tax=Eleusine coracana subsp. coracana TaxID=191504 RepID=A0AAV5BH60_ELECO|nr:hypothetical protein PR202_ga00690 [Eleusine coracana subsp. coracana]
MDLAASENIEVDAAAGPVEEERASAAERHRGRWRRTVQQIHEDPALLQEFALRSELDAARARTRQLARDHMRSHVSVGGEEAERQQQMREEEMHAWKSPHREKSAAAARVVASELDEEQRAERVGARLGEALAEAEAALPARADAERERRARERAEKARDELALAAVGGPVAERRW